MDPSTIIDELNLKFNKQVKRNTIFPSAKGFCEIKLDH